MKNIVKTLLITVFSAVLFVCCKQVKSVAGNTYTLTVDGEKASIYFAEDGTFTPSTVSL